VALATHVRAILKSFLYYFKKFNAQGFGGVSNDLNSNRLNYIINFLIIIEILIGFFN